MRDIGKMGENTLSMWASQVGIAANHVTQDQTGWDFLLELEPIRAVPNTLSLALDKGVNPIQCLVQVKASDHHPGRWRVKLDNWVRFIRSPLPAFFLALEFDNQPQCQRAFLVHVDKKYMGQVLKKLREISSKNNAPKLHEVDVYFKYDQQDQLLSLDGVGLEQAIRNCVGADMGVYVQEKLTLLTTIGYEEQDKKLKFLLPIPKVNIDAQEYLMDFLLGLIPQVQVTNLEMEDMRFGIAAPDPTFMPIDQAFLEIGRTPIEKAEIKFSAFNGLDEIVIETEVFAPPPNMLEVVDQKYHKIRFSAPFLDIIMSGDMKTELKFGLPELKTLRPLKDVYQVFQVIKMLHIVREKNDVIGVSIKSKKQIVADGEIRVNVDLNPTLADVAIAVDRAWKLAKFFDIHDVVDVQLFELMQQKSLLMLAEGIVVPDTTWFKFTFSLDDKVDSNRRFCIPIVVDVVLGQYRVLMAIAVFGSVELIEHEGEDGGSYQIVTRDSFLYRKHQFLRDDEMVRYTPEDLLDFIVEKHKADILFLGDVGNIFSGGRLLGLR